MKKGFDSESRKQVVVVGGGTAGFPSAVAAARNGADTLLVERFECLGGMMTGGLVHALHGMRIQKYSQPIDSYKEVGYHSRQVIRGICQEIHDRLVDIGAAYGHKGEATSRVLFDPEAMKLLADEMLEEAGAEIWLQSLMTDVLVEDGRLKAVVIENKSGRHLVKADAFVDASGDADVAYLCGSPWEMGRKEDGRCMAMTLAFIMGNVNLGKTLEYLKNNCAPSWGKELLQKVEAGFRENKPIELGGFSAILYQAHKKGDLPLAIGAKGPIPAFFINSLIHAGTGTVQHETSHIVDMAYGLDGTNAKDLTKALIEARKRARLIADFLKKYVPGYEKSYFLQSASQLGIRETRTIVGEYVLKAEDILESRKFEDKVVVGGRSINVHSEVGGEEENSGQRWIEIDNDEPYDVPYRCLLPQKVDGFLVAGRCVSVDHMAIGSLRGEPLCIATGEAAGTAAALAAKDRISPKEVNIKKLQKLLLNQGVYLG